MELSHKIKHSNIDLTQGNPLKVIIFYTIPLLFGNLFQQFYNVVDSYIVGNYINDAALAAVSSSASLISLFISLFQGIAVGAGILLAQYFGAPYEDSEGNYLDIRLTSRYQEMLEFLNNCNKEGIIKSANYSDKAAQIRTNIARGKCFVTAVTPQDYQMAYLNAYGSNIKYIPLVLTNKDGEAPILQDISGNGYLLTMITKNCKRPDKAIKLLEYLYSEEGQRLVAFGVEGESYNWNSDHTQIVWTNRYVNGVNGDKEDQAWINTLGLYNMTLVMNLAYIEKIKPLNGRKETDIYIDNMKRPLTPYSYNFKPTFLKHDTGDKNYFTISTNYNKIKTKWAEALVNIIRASDWKSEYDNAVTYAKRQGLEKVNEFYSTSYQSTKKLLNVTWGYPKNNPSYVEPAFVTSNGDFSYWRGAIHE